MCESGLHESAVHVQMNAQVSCGQNSESQCQQPINHRSASHVRACQESVNQWIIYAETHLSFADVPTNRRIICHLPVFNLYTCNMSLIHI